MCSYEVKDTTCCPKHSSNRDGSDIFSQTHFVVHHLPPAGCQLLMMVDTGGTLSVIQLHMLIHTLCFWIPIIFVSIRTLSISLTL